MFPLQPNIYLRWRAHRLDGCLLGEKPDQAPAEALLQQIWLYQRLVRDKLRTVDGRAVRVLHPGFWNHEPGPDFRQAIVQFENEPAVTGDIEIDLLPNGWEQHGHHLNRSYRKVILHVTWEPGTPRHNLPAIFLKHALDSPLEELALWLGADAKPPPESLIGKCSGPLRSLDQQVTRGVIRQAAQARLQRKAEQIQARARQLGWEGALWEGLFAALGYKRNVWPMRRMAELLPMIRNEASAEPLVMQSRMLGIAGLLPSETRQPSSEPYIRQLWDSWWRESEQFRDYVLPSELWQLGGIRPANHPQRRLALAAHWVSKPDLTERMENWLTRQIESPDLVASLDEIVRAPEDPFWSYHWTLRSARLRSPQNLLGEQRVTDLAMNVVLPWLYVRAWAGRNEAFAKRAEARYFLWPSGEDNSVLRLARQRLFGGVKASFLKTAAEQQGLIQIVRDFCDHSNAACDDCQFPDLLRAIVVRE